MTLSANEKATITVTLDPHHEFFDPPFEPVTLTWHAASEKWLPSTTYADGRRVQPKFYGCNISDFSAVVAEVRCGRYRCHVTLTHEELRGRTRAVAVLDTTVPKMRVYVTLIPGAGKPKVRGKIYAAPLVSSPRLTQRRNEKIAARREAYVSEMTVRQVSELTGMSVPIIKRFVTTGELDMYKSLTTPTGGKVSGYTRKYGGIWLISIQDLEMFLTKKVKESNPAMRATWQPRLDAVVAAEEAREKTLMEIEDERQRRQAQVPAH